MFGKQRAVHHAYQPCLVHILAVARAAESFVTFIDIYTHRNDCLVCNDAAKLHKNLLFWKKLREIIRAGGNVSCQGIVFWETNGRNLFRKTIHGSLRSKSFKILFKIFLLVIPLVRFLFRFLWDFEADRPTRHHALGRCTQNSCSGKRLLRRRAIRKFISKLYRRLFFILTRMTTNFPLIFAARNRKSTLVLLSKVLMYSCQMYSCT